MKISVCIPTYEMYGRGAEFLAFSLERIVNQTYQDFEVVISDQSTDDTIFEVVSSYKNRLNLLYNRTEGRGSSLNTNTAIRMATGDVVKILFQDDFLHHEGALHNIADVFSENVKIKWVITESYHTTDGITLYNLFRPIFNLTSLQQGKNTISSPSVLSFRNEDPIFFDEGLTWVMDTDYYIRLYERYGEPTVLKIPGVVNRIWTQQHTNAIPMNTKETETRSLWRRFKNK